MTTLLTPPDKITTAGAGNSPTKGANNSATDTTPALAARTALAALRVLVAWTFPSRAR